MAILTNGSSGGSYLAVELRIDKRLQPISPFARRPVVSWDVPDELYERLQEAAAEIAADWDDPASDWPPSGADWPPIDRAKVGWLACTIRFVVGTAVIYQQSLLVQYTTFWEWYHALNSLVTTHHKELDSGDFEPES